MPLVQYRLDDAIEAFFSGKSAKRQQCDQFAINKFGGPVEPVMLQGLNSYTVMVGGHKIVQFREDTSTLDMEVLMLAKDIHEDFVARYTDLGWIGRSGESPLVIYEMDKLSGVNYINARYSFIDKLNLQLATVQSLARFFSQSWRRPADPDKVDLSIVTSKCYAVFNYLICNLPQRFTPAVVEVQSNLPRLLSGTHPLVLTHADLNEMNILVDPRHGGITGVVDWLDASFQPFGFTLYALDNALGAMNRDGWQYFDNADYLRDEFWKAFHELVGGTLSSSQSETIRLARNAGLLIRYGTPYNNGFTGMVGVRDVNSDDFAYLDALL